MLPRLPRPRPLLLIALFTSLTSLGYFIYFYNTHEMSPAHRHNAALAYAPAWSHPLVGSLFPDPNDPDGVRFDVPTIFDELEAAPPLDTWPIPQLGVTGKHKPKPALLFLHVFSTGTKSAREKREVIRRHSVVEMLDPRWRGLVEMRFVLGKGDHVDATNSTEGASEDWREREEEEKAIEMEQAEYGDLIRLEGLLGGYNMNQGKSWDWIRWVGKESKREAQWVFKCDDDTIPILPNLLTYLLSLDPSKPTYLGTSLGRYNGFHFYFQGMMYGMSWNVIKTIASADVPAHHRQYSWHEDARIGALMYSLPSSSSCAQDHPSPSDKTCDPHTPPPGGYTTVPPSPDPRTGLHRVDVSLRLGDYGTWYIAGVGRALGWHYLKGDEAWIKAWSEVDTYVRKTYGPNGWIPPKGSKLWNIGSYEVEVPATISSHGSEEVVDHTGTGEEAEAGLGLPAGVDEDGSEIFHEI